MNRAQVLRLSYVMVSSQKPTHGLFRGLTRTGAVCTHVSWVGKAEAEFQDVTHSGIFALSKRGLKNHVKT